MLNIKIYSSEEKIIIHTKNSFHIINFEDIVSIINLEKANKLVIETINSKSIVIEHIYIDNDYYYNEIIDRVKTYYDKNE